VDAWIYGKKSHAEGPEEPENGGRFLWFLSVKPFCLPWCTINDPKWYQNSVSESTLPSGSLNHAIFAPLGEAQMPSSSCGIPG
jgi:hypothetical protein